jgi:hypothetical protein
VAFLVVSPKMAQEAVCGVEKVKKIINGFLISPLDHNVYPVVLDDMLVPIHHIDKHSPEFNSFKNNP